VRPRTAFTLVELALALAILAVLAAGIAPVAIRQVEIRYAQRTGREVTAIQEAAKWFYVDQRAWPASIDQLKASGYLNATWGTATPWGTPYALAAAPATLSVSATVPAGLEGVLTQYLIAPTTAPAGNDQVTVTSTIPIPGKEASLAMLVHKQGDTMTGPLVLRNAGLSVYNAAGGERPGRGPGLGPDLDGVRHDGVPVERQRVHRLAVRAERDLFRRRHRVSFHRHRLTIERPGAGRAPADSHGARPSACPLSLSAPILLY
jgi:prepilin-type N-terminal cleavage/methylation domain-containing protein